MKSTALMVLGAGMGAGCSYWKMGGTFQTSEDRITKRFMKVDISEDRIQQTAVGLRPYRPSGFVVEREEMGNKSIIHNYGHGGSGVTLSWGTAHLAVEKAKETGHTTCAVIGCGVVGLTTARLLQKRGFKVTLYTREFPCDTTSYAAGALWSPFQFGLYDTPELINGFTQAARLSHQYFRELIGGEYGVSWIEHYSFTTNPAESNGRMSSIQDLLLDSTELERSDYPFSYPYAYRTTTLLIEMPVFLNALLQDFLRAGGGISIRGFRDIGEVLALQEPVIINCTGAGAKQLFGDRELVPIKGQVIILLAQPEIHYTTSAEGYYMIPRRDGIVLGSTYEWENWTLKPNESATRTILDWHRTFFNSIT